MELTETPQYLIRALYPELRRLAGQLLSHERPDHTLQRTALVHELFLRISRRSAIQDLNSRRFLALAAHEMRQILVDHGRRYRSRKRGGDVPRVSILDIDLGFGHDQDALLALNEALERLGRLDSRALSVVELKYFAGFTTEETAAILAVSNGTIEAVWQHARLWLFKELTRPSPRPSPVLLGRIIENPQPA